MDSADVSSPQMRRAGRDLLSLALMDARNRTLRWLAVFEDAPGAPGAAPPPSDLDPPLWRIGHVGWFQERWIARNVHRQRGDDTEPGAPRLASVLPDADRWYDPAQSARAERWRLDLPDARATRQYLADSMELTLELLDGADESDAGLYAFRLALFHEDLQSEALAETAQALGIALPPQPGLLDPIVATPPRPPLLFPAARWLLGAAPGSGFVFDNEKWAHEVAVPEFEIDAQPVTWAQFAEFVEDGGYDEPRWWTGEGRAWLQREGRRAPRYVDQLRGGVLQERFGRLARVPSAQPALHVGWHEAAAWCRWAGRRLPAEVEWEAAAQSYSRGFAWGNAWEWTAGTFRAYPGFRAGPAGELLPRGGSGGKAQRGGSFATPARVRQPKLRRGAGPEDDRGFCGFRSCAP